MIYDINLNQYFYLKSEIDTLLDSYYTKSEIDDLIGDAITYINQ